MNLSQIFSSIIPLTESVSEMVEREKIAYYNERLTVARERIEKCTKRLESKPPLSFARQRVS